MLTHQVLLKPSKPSHLLTGRRAGSVQGHGEYDRPQGCRPTAFTSSALSFLSMQAAEFRLPTEAMVRHTRSLHYWLSGKHGWGEVPSAIKRVHDTTEWNAVLGQSKVETRPGQLEQQLRTKLLQPNEEKSPWSFSLRKGTMYSLPSSESKQNLTVTVDQKGPRRGWKNGCKVKSRGLGLALSTHLVLTSVQQHLQFQRIWRPRLTSGGTRHTHYTFACVYKVHVYNK